MNKYLQRDFFQVDGYTSFFDACVIDSLLEVQALAQVTGSMAEIGVHHGRSFFLLALARRPGERVLAIDVFEDDAIYQDPLGLGRGMRFKQNCQRLGIALGPDEIFSGLSTTLDADEVHRRVGPVRLFSVDGGHRYDDVAHDLRLAAASLHPRGVIVADDYMNVQWPEVSLAIVDWLKETGESFAPFLSTASKLYLCPRPERDFYRAHVRQFLATGRHQMGETDLFTDSYFYSRQTLRDKVHYFVKERMVARLPRRHAPETA